MAKTFNRSPISFDVPGADDVANTVFSQTQWTGINENANVFGVDQNSFEDAENVYVNDDNLLSSRPSLFNLYNKDGVKEYYKTQSHLIVAIRKDVVVFYVLNISKNELQFNEVTYPSAVVAPDETFYITEIFDTLYVFSDKSIYKIENINGYYTLLSAVENIYVPYEGDVKNLLMPGAYRLDENKTADDYNDLVLNASRYENENLIITISSKSNTASYNWPYPITDLKYNMVNRYGKIDPSLSVDKEIFVVIDNEPCIIKSTNTSISIIRLTDNHLIKEINVDFGVHRVCDYYKSNGVIYYLHQINSKVTLSTLNLNTLDISDRTLTTAATKGYPLFGFVLEPSHVYSDNLVMKFAYAHTFEDGYPYLVFAEIKNESEVVEKKICRVTGSLFATLNELDGNELWVYPKYGDGTEYVATNKLNDYVYILDVNLATYSSSITKLKNSKIGYNVFAPFVYGKLDTNGFTYTITKNDTNRSSIVKPFKDAATTGFRTRPLYAIDDTNEEYYTGTAMFNFRTNTVDSLALGAIDNYAITDSYYDDDNKTFWFIGSGYIYTTASIATEDPYVYNFKYAVNAVYEPYVPTLISESNDALFVVDNKTYLLLHTFENGVIKLYLPENKDNDFYEKIENVIPLESNNYILFTKNSIWYANEAGQDDKLLPLYTYNKSKMKLNIVENSDYAIGYDGATMLLPTYQGLAGLTYNQIVAVTEHIVSYLSDNIYNNWLSFTSNDIKFCNYKYYLFVYAANENIVWVYDYRYGTWWKWRFEQNIKIMATFDNYCLVGTDDAIYQLDESTLCTDWFVKSQKLHLGAPNNYKQIKKFIVHTLGDQNDDMVMNLQFTNYRKRMFEEDDVTVDYDVDFLRTYIKRCNYPKVLYFQYKLSNNDLVKKPLFLNGINIQYRVGGEIK